MSAAPATMAPGVDMRRSYSHSSLINRMSPPITTPPLSEASSGNLQGRNVETVSSNSVSEWLEKSNKNIKEAAELLQKNQVVTRQECDPKGLTQIVESRQIITRQAGIITIWIDTLASLLVDADNLERINLVEIIKDKAAEIFKGITFRILIKEAVFARSNVIIKQTSLLLNSSDLTDDEIISRIIRMV